MTGRDESPTDLVLEALSRQALGEAIDVGAMAARAGERGGELVERLGILLALDSVAEVLGDGDRDGPPDAIRRLERFEVRREVGRGGFSQVFLARDLVLERDVALKVLDLPRREAERVREWVITEGRSLAKLSHPGVVGVHDVDRDGSYVVMEWIEGPNLHEALRAMRDPGGAGHPGHTEGALRVARSLEPIGARCRLVARVARALAHCHDQGVVHRDVKPANVVVGESGAPKLIDFGIAHLAGGGDLRDLTDREIGTLDYFAPEQIERGAVGADARSDQFALGVVLYELLTLRHPFRRDTPHATLQAISRTRPSPPRRIDASVPDNLERIVLHCLERAPEERYARVGELADDLERFLDHRAISLERPSPARALWRWLVRNRGRVATLLAGALLLLLGGWVVGFRTRLSLRAWAEEARRVAARVEEPAEFERLFREVGAQSARSQLLDGSLAGWVFPTTGGWVREAADVASRRLHARVSEAYGRAREEVERAGQLLRYEEIRSDWAPALEREAPLAAHVGGEEEVHRPGTVEIPPEGELYRYDRWKLPSRAVLEAHPPGAVLGPGFYRYVTFAGEQPREMDFEVYATEPRWTVEPRPLSDALAARAVRVEPPDGRPFLVLDHAVTWSEAREVLTERELEHALRFASVPYKGVASPLGDDDPALLTWSLAKRFVDRVGGRLPTPEELRAAHRAGAFREEPGFEKEWTSTFRPARNARFALRYEHLDTGPEAEAQWLHTAEEDGMATGTCFRIVRTAEH